MRKRRINVTDVSPSRTGGRWLDLSVLAQVEITSEDPSSPIEAALVTKAGATGWRAATPGEQLIRLLFDEPQWLRRVLLEFVETQAERTQEIVLRWSSDGANYQGIMRQQWNFSPNGSTHQLEDYQVDLSGVVALELTIKPDIGGGDAYASLARLSIAGKVSSAGE